MRFPAWLAVVLVFVLMVAVHLADRELGLDRAAALHLLYVPVVLGALRLGPVWGGAFGVFAASGAWAAALDAGDVVTERLTAASIALVLAGFFVGSALRAVVVAQQRDLAEWWEHELGLTAGGSEPSSVLTDDRVRSMVTTRDFYPVFQPIYGLEDGRLIATEALTRFDSEPPVPPNQWFARASELGLGVDLELAAIEKALDACGQLPSHVAMSVNASAATLLEPRLLELVERAPRRVMLELTELEPVTDYDELFAALTRLRRAGSRFAIDNVGASLTSLRHIGRLVPDVLKLDGQLTNDSRSDPVRWALTRRLLRYAQTNGTHLIAEGIEEAEDLDAWRELGALGAQGYLLGRPGPITFPDPITFPTSRGRGGRRVHRGGDAGLAGRSRDGVRSRGGADESLAQSQLGDGDFWGRAQ